MRRIILSSLTAGMACVSGYAQQAQVNPAVIYLTITGPAPGYDTNVAPNGNAYIDVAIMNTGPQAVPINAFSVLISIDESKLAWPSGGPSADASFTENGNGPKWAIIPSTITPSGFSIRNTGGIIGVGEAATFHVNVKALTTAGPANAAVNVGIWGPLGGQAYDINQSPESNSGLSHIWVTTPLPVTFTAFTAAKKGTSSLLNWNTASEKNNVGFDIERSSNGKNFTRIDNVATKAEQGNSCAPLHYSYTDNAPMQGINYYRLRQVDKDGHYDYSTIASVYFGNIVGNVKIYPNPAIDNIFVDAEEGSSISIFTITGQKLLVNTHAKGRITSLDVSALAAGNYVVTITDSSGTSNHKVTVK
jgi:hypothetical protein